MVGWGGRDGRPQTAARGNGRPANRHHGGSSTPHSVALRQITRGVRRTLGTERRPALPAPVLSPAVTPRVRSSSTAEAAVCRHRTPCQRCPPRRHRTARAPAHTPPDRRVSCAALAAAAATARHHATAPPSGGPPSPAPRWGAQLQHGVLRGGGKRAAAAVSTEACVIRRVRRASPRGAATGHTPATLP